MHNQHQNQTSRRRFLGQGGKVIAGFGALNLLGPAELFGRKLPQLRAGVVKKKITPPVSIPYLKSSMNGTCGVFRGVHDELFARALVLDDGVKTIALLAVDAIGYDNSVLGPHSHFTKELRRRVYSATRIPSECVMLTATHAHATPETIGLTEFRHFNKANEWIETHLQDLVDTVAQASKQRVAVRARFGSIPVYDIARNRRILLKNGHLSVYGTLPPESQVAIPWSLDEDLSVLHLEKENGATHSLVLNYTAHPVITMLLPQISADYPGAAAAFVERAFPDAVCLFTQGAAGNINSIKVSSSYEDATVLGEKVGAAAVEQVGKLKTQNPLENFVVNAKSTEIHLEPRPCPSLSNARKATAKNPSSENLRLFRLAQKLDDEPLHAEIQAMRLGPVNWISFPGEPFVETGFAMKRAGASFVCGYANGWLGYFPIRRAYSEGGYEVGLGAWSRVAQGSAEALESAAIEFHKKFLT